MKFECYSENNFLVKYVISVVATNLILGLIYFLGLYTMIAIVKFNKANGATMFVGCTLTLSSSTFSYFNLHALEQTKVTVATLYM